MLLLLLFGRQGRRRSTSGRCNRPRSRCIGTSDIGRTCRGILGLGCGSCCRFWRSLFEFTTGKCRGIIFHGGCLSPYRWTPFRCRFVDGRIFLTLNGSTTLGHIGYKGDTVHNQGGILGFLLGRTILIFRSSRRVALFGSKLFATRLIHLFFVLIAIHHDKEIFDQSRGSICTIIGVGKFVTVRLGSDGFFFLGIFMTGIAFIFGRSGSMRNNGTSQIGYQTS
mmetsp:Transcript_18971/g.29221  ORF Transcript_18971/g.29221 Transcript_18971/m.29221 type:complete len:223 (-) Transcript_18971:757-1425(-)